MLHKYRYRIYAFYTNTVYWQKTHIPNTFDVSNIRRAFLTQLVHRHFPTEHTAQILDIGCGHGTLIHVARKMGYENIRGIDASLAQIETANRLGIDGIFHGDAMETLTAEADDSLDCVISFDFIEHFSKTELIELVDEVFRVLKPGGRWIIHAPNGESPFGNRILFGDYTHEQAFTRTSISQLLLSSGFNEVNCHEDRPVAHGAKSGIRLLLWHLMRFFMWTYIAIETGDTSRDAIFSQNFLTIARK